MDGDDALAFFWRVPVGCFHLKKRKDMNRLGFFGQYLRNPRGIGALAPSSRHLARTMTEAVDFQKARVIVEYGPGTGAFTDRILERRNPKTVLLLVESNRAFAERLRARYAGVRNLILAVDSAENIGALLERHKLPEVDGVISGLPFASLPGKVSRSILAETSRVLGRDGLFVTFQYTLLKKALIGRYFDRIEIKREPKNFPPAWVLVCGNQGVDIETC
jgi:phospholipid N-methyltransferase